MAHDREHRGNRFTARLVKSPMLSTEPQSSPASTNSSGNSPGSRLKSRSPGATGARHRDHTRQTGRVRQRRPSRGGQPERGAAAVAGRGRVGNYPERADVGTGHRGAGQRAGQLLEVLDEVAQPKVKQATADEIFWAQTGLDARRPGSLCWVGGRMVEARDGQTWAVDSPGFGAQRRRPGRWQRPGQGAEAGACPTCAAGSRISRIRWLPRSARVAVPCGNLGRGSRALERAEAAQKEWTGWAVREIADGPRHTTAACGVRPRGFGIRRWPPRGLEADPTAFESSRPKAASTIGNRPRRLWRGAAPLSGPAWAKTRRLLLRRESFTFLDQHTASGELGWTPTSCRPCWTWKACSAKPGDCRSQRPAQPRHGLGRWPARSNWRRQNPTGRI